MAKDILIVKASSDICVAEVNHLKAIAGLYSMNVCVAELNTIDEFKVQVCKGRRFDYLYIAAHADLKGFGEANGTPYFQWEEFALALCEADCLNPGAVLMLACCRGGLKTVAYSLFYSCDRIDYICGPRWTVTSHELSAGFHVFIYNLEVRREQPSTAVERVSKATGYDFFSYDRVEIEDQAFSAALATRDQIRDRE
jgi:hypothetical protein